ncbi:hypothetical protein T484DRAFT_1943449 [Baffinella frigidus]|nr:hypothetical protein T484DRAFT_1943449 [Cryptophyta sp. CCMP2293]
MLYQYHVPNPSADGLPENSIPKLFERDGIIVIRQFASPEEVAGMKGQMAALIDAWDPADSKGSVFHTYGSTRINQEYFLESAATVRFFLEPEAVDKEGAVRTDIPKDGLINKAGHALHFLDPVFAAYSQSEKVKQLVRSLGYIDPVLPQSMYIFKQGKIGGEVTSHQDSTFLFTEPQQTCLGLWLALDDATLDNGCLWARRGSHREAVRSVFRRTPPETPDGDIVLRNEMVDANGDEVEGTAGFRAREWTNKIPGGCADYGDASSASLADAGFEALPVKAGDLVCFAGTLDHLSLANRTSNARHTFQLHLVEGPNGSNDANGSKNDNGSTGANGSKGVKWSDGNWMQYPEGLVFPSLGLAP